MRHQVKGRKLGRTTPHRKATMQALSVALIKEKRIKTTLPKAKELRTFVEPIITKSKSDTTHNRRQVFASLRDKKAVTELFDVVAPEVGERPGGYTRVLKLGTRLGDAAQMAVIELVDFNDVKPEKKESKKKRTRRAGKSNKPTGSDDTSAKKSSAKEESKKEEPKAAAAAEEAEVSAAADVDVEETEAAAETQEEKAEETKKPVAEAEEDAEAAEDSEADAKAEADADTESEGDDEESDDKK